VGDPGLIPGSGRSLGEGNGNPLQYSYLENPMDRGAWLDGITNLIDMSLSKLQEITKDREVLRDAVHGVEKSWT